MSIAAFHGIARTTGTGIDSALALVTPDDVRAPDSVSRDALLAAVNGVIGDHLHATDNPLQITMQLRHDGTPLELSADGIARAIPGAGGRILVLAHGLCMNDRQWRRNDHDHGAALAAASGFTPVYLHYNSGLHLSGNGRAFAQQLEEMVRAWPVPVERLAIIGYSMGGLLARIACDHGRRSKHLWRSKLGDIVFLGTPHSGSPLERVGHRVDALLGASRYTAALSRIGKLRSAGITDLRHGSLFERDWQDPADAGADPGNSTHMPLPRGVRCHAIAGSIDTRPGSLRSRELGDGLVPLDSALGMHTDRARSLRIPASRRWIGYGLNHLDLLDDAGVYNRIGGWLAKTPGEKPARKR